MKMGRNRRSLVHSEALARSAAFLGSKERLPAFGIGRGPGRWTLQNHGTL